jgi:hypothetical protein
MQKEGRDTRQRQEEPRKTTTNNGRRCYNCGSDKHLRRHCPMQRDTTFQSDPRQERTKVYEPKSEDLSQDQSSKTEEHSRIVHSIKESGAYVTAKIFGMDTYLLIDTGATVPLLSKVCYGNMFGTKHRSVEKVESDVLSANGSPVDVCGKTSIDLVLNGTTMSHEMIIADLSVDGILGLDFFVKYEAIINMRTHKVEISGIEHSIHLEGMAHEYKIALVNRVVIPPRSKIMIEGKICAGLDGGLPVKIGLAKPSEKFRKSDSALLARALVRRQETVPLRIMNLSSTNQALQSGTVGKLSPVNEVVSLACPNRLGSSTKEVPKHLRELFDRSTKNLEITEKNKAKSLLIRYSDLFSVTDKDAGRTSMASHKIDTGSQPAIKQAPRRIPFHMQKEVQEHVSNMLERGIIEPSQSDWSSAIVLVKKKDESKRFCVDYQRLNNVTIKDAYPPSPYR